MARVSGVRVALDRTGILALDKNPAAVAEARRTASAIARQARAHAPVHTGAYQDSISVDGTTALSDDFAAHMIEWGSANNPPYAPFRNAVRRLGLGFEDRAP